MSSLLLLWESLMTNNGKEGIKGKGTRKRRNWKSLQWLWVVITIHAYIAMYICLYTHVCIYVTMYHHIYICVHIYLCVYTYIYMYVYRYMCMCVHMYIQWYIVNKDINIYSYSFMMERFVQSMVWFRSRLDSCFVYDKHSVGQWARYRLTLEYQQAGLGWLLRLKASWIYRFRLT